MDQFPFTTQSSIRSFIRTDKPVIEKINSCWAWLITPAVPLPQSVSVRKARLLSAMLLVSIVLGVFGEFVYRFFSYDDNFVNPWLILVCVLLMLAAYVINQMGYFTAAVWSAIMSQVLTVFVLTYSTTQPVDKDFLTFLTIPLLFASLFLSPYGFLILSGVLLILMELSAVIVPETDPIQIAVGPAFFMLAISGLIFMIDKHRSNVEADRQKDLAEREERYRTLLESGYEGVCVIKKSKIIDANPGIARMFGYDLSEFLGQPIERIFQQELGDSTHIEHRPSKNSQKRISVFRKNGEPFHIEVVFREQLYRGEQVQVIAVRDVSEQVQAEEALDQSECLYRSLFESANDAIFLLNFDNIHIAVNQKGADLLGYTVEEFLGKPVWEIVAPWEQLDSMKIRAALLEGKNPPLYERTFRRKDGSTFTAEINITLVRSRDGTPLYFQSIVRDITDRKCNEERIQRQLERLKALREIDAMITGSLSLRLTLEVLLTKVVSQLDVDAADILLLHPHMQQLEYYAGSNIELENRKWELIPIRDELASRTIFQRQFTGPIDLCVHEIRNERLSRLCKQGYRIGYAVPLIAKGKVKGVLEVFLRKDHEISTEWVEFLETLGGQAAIAIDSIDLFENLQRSNSEIIRSYDATLEGWARALELRDKETEGHCKRVTEMTMQLARALGVSEANLIHIRRGALLHDIGKMGIPDSILLKPGPLTDEEWEVMKQHPVYAREMLASIAFLSPALDIPYSHHERWDGSGYPLGTRGEQIPLPARIFAVVDVWDALTNERPYRRAWSTEQALQYLCEQAGFQFDPVIVEVFLKQVGGAPVSPAAQPAR